MQLKDLKVLVSKGESESLEFKRSTGQRTDAAKTVCAMLNGLGGFLLFGVDDDGKIVGQDVSAHTIEDVARELRRIEPPVFPEIKSLTLDNGRKVIAVRSVGEAAPYLFDGRPYIRHGTTTSIMPRDEYERRLLERLHATRRWENEPVAAGVTLADLDADEIKLTVENAIQTGRLKPPRSRELEVVLRGLGLIADDHLLNAAVVLYGKAARLEVMYPQCAIRLARFRGKDRLADFADNRQYWGHAFDLLRRAESFLRDHIPIAGRVIPGQLVREDLPAYPPRATREALANALCHRDYAIPGGAVAVAMYDDHMEVTNPGTLHFGITPEQLAKPHESKPWNPIIAGVFYRAGVIERWGSGTLNILDWCRENGNPPPAWTHEAGSVFVTFAPIPGLAAAGRKLGLESGARVGLESEARVGGDVLVVNLLSSLKAGPLGRLQIAQKLGHSRVSGAVNRAIKQLMDESLIEYTIPEKPNSRLQKYRLTEKGSQFIVAQSASKS